MTLCKITDKIINGIEKSDKYYKSVGLLLRNSRQNRVSNCTGIRLKFGFFVFSMIIEKIINNNVVIVSGDNGKETIVMGKGIGFQAKAGQHVDEQKIEKRFILDSESDVGRFGELVSSIPLEHFEVCMKIIDYAMQVMQRRLSNSIYISLTDHINFALERYKSGVVFENPLLQEVRSFYPSEYLIGEYALTLVEHDLGAKLPVDEAASIALHFVNAEYKTAMSDTMNITTLIRQILNIVDEELDMNLDELGLHYSRFVTHLKFLAYRVFAGQMMCQQEEELVRMVKSLYKREYAISEKVALFIREQCNHEIAEEEKAYLTLHIRRIQPNISGEDTE